MHDTNPKNLSAVILCGGKGTRLSEYSNSINKPLIKIGEVPIVLHVAFRFWLAGFREINILGGWQYKKFENGLKEAIEDAKTNKYFGEMASQTIFRIHDTGQKADTFERINKISSILATDKFLITYGDTITDLDCQQLIKSYQKDSKNFNAAMVSVVRPNKRFSTVSFDASTNKVKIFEEKVGKEKEWVGCGFMLIPKHFIERHKTCKSLEKEFLPKLVVEQKLFAYQHYGLWHPIDYIIDVQKAEALYQEQSSMGYPSWLNIY